MSWTYANTHDTITKIKVIDISNTSKSVTLLLCVKVLGTQHEIYLPDKIEVHHTVLLTISSMLHSRFLELIHLA